jgi:hypothetical protein
MGEPRDLQKILQSEHYGVYQSMGKHYLNVVRNMLRAGNFLMDDQHMEGLLSDIAGLANQVCVVGCAQVVVIWLYFSFALVLAVVNS